MTEKLTIVEAICYLYPHKEDIVASSPSMKTSWTIAANLLKAKNSFFAPLLVDDLKRSGFIQYQSVEDLIKETTNKSYKDFRWFGPPILESSIEHQYGNLGCKLFDSLYHRDVLSSLSIVGNWKWIAVHPVSFQDQQAGMLLELWKQLSRNVSFSSLADSISIKTDYVRNMLREDFFSHFEHQWIDKSGKLIDITVPKYTSKKVQHISK